MRSTEAAELWELYERAVTEDGSEEKGHAPR